MFVDRVVHASGEVGFVAVFLPDADGICGSPGFFVEAEAEDSGVEEFKFVMGAVVEAVGASFGSVVEIKNGLEVGVMIESGLEVDGSPSGGFDAVIASEVKEGYFDCEASGIDGERRLVASGRSGERLKRLKRL